MTEEEFTKLKNPDVNISSKNENIEGHEEEINLVDEKVVVKTSQVSKEEGVDFKTDETAFPEIPGDKEVVSIFEEEMQVQISKDEIFENVNICGTTVVDKQVAEVCLEEVSEAELAPDVVGLFTMALVVPSGPDPAMLSELEEDIAWFDSPVSIMFVENGNTVIEVKMRNKAMAVAALKGLESKYPGLEG